MCLVENNKHDYLDICSDSATVMTTIKEVTFMSDLIFTNSFGQFIHKGGFCLASMQCMFVFMAVRMKISWQKELLLRKGKNRIYISHNHWEIVQKICGKQGKQKTFNPWKPWKINFPSKIKRYFIITRWILGGCGLVMEVTDLIKTLMESESGHDQRESNVFSSGDWVVLFTGGNCFSISRSIFQSWRTFILCRDYMGILILDFWIQHTVQQRAATLQYAVYLTWAEAP